MEDASLELPIDEEHTAVYNKGEVEVFLQENLIVQLSRKTLRSARVMMSKMIIGL